MDNIKDSDYIDYDDLNESYEFLKTDEGIVITRFIGDYEEVEIPNGVIKISEEAFINCDDICSVIIPNSVKVIERSAFESCESLEEIVIPDSVEELGESAFDNCCSLKSITISNSIKVIKKRTFANTAIREIAIPDSVTLIEDCAFESCGNLIRVFKEDALIVQGKAFYNSKYYKNNYLYHKCKKNIDDITANFVYGDGLGLPYFDEAFKVYSGRDNYDDFDDLATWLINLDDETFFEFATDCSEGLKNNWKY